MVDVEDETGEEVCRTEATIPPNDGEEVLTEDAFTHTTDDEFTSQTWLDGEQAGAFNYEITCSEENGFPLDVEDSLFSSGYGDPVEYVDR